MRMDFTIAGQRPSERGSVILVVMATILALTGLGAVAFNTALSATRTADAFGMQNKAIFAADVAVLSGVEFLDWNLDAVIAYAEGSGQYVFEHTDPIRSGVSVADLFGTNPFENAHLEPFFRVVYTDIAPARRAPEFDEGFCYMRLYMEGQAGVRDTLRLDDAAVVTIRSLRGGLVTREFAGHFYVGPVRCPGYAG